MRQKVDLNGWSLGKAVPRVQDLETKPTHSSGLLGSTVQIRAERNV